MSKANDRSGRTVTRAGMGTPGLICEVRALNSYKIKVVFRLVKWTDKKKKKKKKKQEEG